MDIPIKDMFSYKLGTLGPTLIGLSYLILPFLLSQAINVGLVLFGLTFLSIGLIKARSKPTVLGCIFAMLIGLSFFFNTMTTIGTSILWTVSLLLFVGVLIFELHIFKFGPSNASAKSLLIVPLAILGFSYLLAFAGYNPMISINWNVWMITFNYLAVMLFCWISVLEVGGYRPFGKDTPKYATTIALISVILVALSFLQGTMLGV